jgi:hypothetical protein
LTGVGHFAQALHLGHGSVTSTIEIAKSYIRHPGVALSAEAVFFNQKTGVGAISAGGAPFSGNLAAGGLDADVQQQWPKVSALGQIETLIRRAQFFLPISAQTAAGTPGGWRQEGHAFLVNAQTFATLSTLAPTEIGSLTVLSQEYLRRGDGAAASMIGSTLLRNLAYQVDVKFLDPTLASSAAGPASITYGATQIGLGSPAAPTDHDLDAMLRTIATPGAALAWIGSPATLARVILSAGRQEARGLLCGLPTYSSGNVPTGLLVLVDLAEIILAAGGFDLSVSTEASVQMSDAPTAEGITPTAATEVSLFQTGMTGYIFSRYVNWQVAHAGAVVYAILG